MTHGLERTSPKGGPFIGRCRYCGLADLPMSAALLPCEKAPSQSQQILDALDRPAVPPRPAPLLGDVELLALNKGHLTDAQLQSAKLWAADDRLWAPMKKQTRTWRPQGVANQAHAISLWKALAKLSRRLSKLEHQIRCKPWR